MPTLAPAASYVSSAGAIRIRTCTFDDWLAATAIDTVALMKIDVEGAEAQVLAGMRASLAAGRIRRLVLETAWEGPSHAASWSPLVLPQSTRGVGPLDNIAYTIKR